MPVIKDEKGVKAQVKKLLDKHKYFWWMPPANGFGASGISDFNALKDGVFIAIETKFAKNKPTPMQAAFLNSVNQESSFGFVVNEDTLEWLDIFLTEFELAKLDAAGKRRVANASGANMLDAIRALQASI